MRRIFYNIGKTFIACTLAMLMTINIVSAQQSGGESLPATAGGDAQENSKDNQKKERDYCRHEFSFWAAGGFSTFNANTKPNFGTIEYRPGGALGFGYSFHFAKRWSVMAGVEAAMYNTRFVVDELNDQINMFDPDGRPIIYNVDLEHYMERTRMYSLNMPLMIQFNTAVGEKGHEFFAAIGGKAGYPLKMKYDVKEAQFYTYGDYIEYGQILFDQNDLGYGDHQAKIKQQDIDMGWSWIGSFETGVKWQFKNPKYSLYTGVYFDWGFNEIRKDEPVNRFLEYDSSRPDRMSLNSVLTSGYSHNGDEFKSFADKISTVSLGVKLRLGINTCPSNYTKAQKNKNTKNGYDNNYQDSYAEGYRDGRNDPGSEEVDRSLRNIEDMMQKMIDNQNSGKVRVVNSGSGDGQQLVIINDTAYAIAKPGDNAKPSESGSTAYGNLNAQDAELISGHIYFDKNSAVVKQSEYAVLDEKVRILKENGDLKIRIIGNTCDLAGNSINLPLGLQRAEAARQYMVGKGIEENRIITASQASQAPLVPNTSEANRKMNRRCDFEVVLK